ncbi:uncharacterized protein LOC123363190 [Mauremys mutica]|uniref:uncharacterized protein LOC123363190 n=1 Tax=Mauremys mutica TaxID=74926 RepID=UPI001D162590|nr:uncharacterized protein LOC123363190 [Mauremys mutica]
MKTPAVNCKKEKYVGDVAGDSKRVMSQDLFETQQASSYFYQVKADEPADEGESGPVATVADLKVYPSTPAEGRVGRSFLKVKGPLVPGPLPCPPALPLPPQDPTSRLLFSAPSTLCSPLLPVQRKSQASATLQRLTTTTRDAKCAETERFETEKQKSVKCERDMAGLEPLEKWLERNIKILDISEVSVRNNPFSNFEKGNLAIDIYTLQ